MYRILAPIILVWLLPTLLLVGLGPGLAAEGSYSLEVSSGTVNGGLASKRSLYGAMLPPGKTAGDVVGIGIASDDHVYVWFDDGTVCAGDSRQLDRHRTLYRYSTPPGKTPADIVAVAISKRNDQVYAWYRDGTVSAGTTADLDRHRAPYSFALPRGKAIKDLVGVAIRYSGGPYSFENVLSFYRDGTRYAGNSASFDRETASGLRYSVADGKTPGDIVGIDQGSEFATLYVWYRP